MTKPDVLTPKLRERIDSFMLHGEPAIDALKGSSKSDDFQQVRGAAEEAYLRLKKIEVTYLNRYKMAMRLRDSSLILAAIYGMEVDMAGRPSAAWNKAFFKDIFARALWVVTKNGVDRWLAEQVGASEDQRRRQALIAYFDEKLATLDELIVKDELQAAPQDDVEPEASAPSP